jgi:hypothetical protein
MEEIKVSVPLSKYLDLLVLAYEYHLLLNSGLDNWDGFEYAFEDYDEEALRKKLLNDIGLDADQS